MSQRILLSFIGTGKYENVDYTYKGGLSHTRYIQAALIDLERQAGVQFDVVLLAMTRQSREAHWEGAGKLRDELSPAVLDRLQELQIDEDLSVESQWANFGKILEVVPPGAELHVDMTHGFRIIPILFSVAAELLVQVKGVRLAAVYYGQYDARTPGPFPVAELSRFFHVTRWTEAVRAVTEDANPHKLVQIVESGDGLEMPGMNNRELVEALTRVAAVIKNADTASAAATFTDAIRAIREARQGAAGLSDALLNLLEQKFSDLSRAGAETRLSRAWYETQLVLAKVMVEHDLLMQGLTVLRELFCSCCEEMCGHAMAQPTNPQRLAYVDVKGQTKFNHLFKDRRRNIGDSLYALVGLENRSDYKPNLNWDEDNLIVKPLTEAVLKERLYGEDEAGDLNFLRDLGKLRNAFNHGWSGKKELTNIEIRRQTDDILTKMAALVERLLDDGRIGRGEPKLA